jgi:hypothetical protein
MSIFLNLSLVKLIQLIKNFLPFLKKTSEHMAGVLCPHKRGEVVRRHERNEPSAAFDGRIAGDLDRLGLL